MKLFEVVLCKLLDYTHVASLLILKTYRDTDKQEQINLAAIASNTVFAPSDRACDPGSVHRVRLFLRSGTSCYSIVSGLLFALPWSLQL
jgi:hypothetical protein